MLRQAPILRNRLCPRATLLGDALSESPGVESLGASWESLNGSSSFPKGASSLDTGLPILGVDPSARPGPAGLARPLGLPCMPN